MTLRRLLAVVVVAALSVLGVANAAPIQSGLSGPIQSGLTSPFSITPSKSGSAPVVPQVVFDANATNFVSDLSGTTFSTINDPNLTVGTGANRMLTVVYFGTEPTTSMVWDSAGANQALTKIATCDGTVFGSDYFIELWALPAPVSGNKNLRASYTAATADFDLNANSFSGTEQNLVNAFYGAQCLQNDGAITNPVVSQSGDAAIDMVTSQAGVTAPVQTQLFLDPASPAGSSYAISTGSSVNFQWTTGNPSSFWADFAVSIRAANRTLPGTVAIDANSGMVFGSATSGTQQTYTATIGGPSNEFLLADIRTDVGPGKFPNVVSATWQVAPFAVQNLSECYEYSTDGNAPFDSWGVPGAHSGTGTLTVNTNASSPFTAAQQQDANVTSFSGVNQSVPCYVPDMETSAVTISHASPAVLTIPSALAVPFTGGEFTYLTTNGTLPSPFVSGTTYYPNTSGITPTTFQETAGQDDGTPINTTTAGSGTHALHVLPFIDSRSEPPQNLTFNPACNGGDLVVEGVNHPSQSGILTLTQATPTQKNLYYIASPAFGGVGGESIDVSGISTGYNFTYEQGWGAGGLNSTQAWSICLKAASAYVGPGDIVPHALAFYSCDRAYNAAYAASGGNACLLVDAATGLTSYTLTVLSNGKTNVAGAAASAACAVACVVKTKYDQSGSSNDAPSLSLANSPAFTFNGVNTNLPTVTFTGSQALVGPTITNAQPFTFSTVYNRTSGNSSILVAFHNGPTVAPNAGANLANVSDGVVSNLSATATDGAWHQVAGVVNGASSAISVDGATPTTGSLGTTAAAGAITIGWNSSSSLQFAGGLTEVGIWESAMSNAQLSALHANASAFYGTP